MTKASVPASAWTAREVRMLSGAEKNEEGQGCWEFIWNSGLFKIEGQNFN